MSESPSTEIPSTEILCTEIAGVPIVDLVREYGTPLYVYDESVIANRVGQLRHFDVIRYAQKACSNLAILDLLRRQDVLVDAVSAGEIQRAVKAGYHPHGNPPPIVYTADIFDHDSLQQCLDLGIHVNCGSSDMIDQLGQASPGRDITLRINPGFGHGHSQKTNTGGAQSKHGIWHSQIDECMTRVDRHGLAVTGVHMHIGSGTDLEHLSLVCDSMEDAVATVGRTVQTISAGGGLPIPYREGESPIDLDEFYRRWDTTRNNLQARLGHSLRLEVEPGRFLVAESGALIAEIRAVKQMGDNLFYLLDAGFNNLARPVLYGAYHPMSVAPADGRPGRRKIHNVVVGGPLCESGDIFTQQPGGMVCHQALPIAAVGDWVVIGAAGAYGQVMASNYNSKPFAAEVLLREGTSHQIRSRQTIAELMANESIPSPSG